MENGGIVKKLIVLTLILLAVMTACTQIKNELNWNYSPSLNTTGNLSMRIINNTAKELAGALKIETTTYENTSQGNAQNSQLPAAPANLTINASKKYFFYTTGCGHCVNVLNYIYANNLSHRLIMTDVDPDSGKTRYRDFATYFNIPANQWGVPVLYANNTYILGDVPIIAYLNKTN